MILKDFLNLFKWSTERIVIWGKDEETPLFEGWMDEVPWTLVDYKIAEDNGEGDGPAHISMCETDRGTSLPTVIICVEEE